MILRQTLSNQSSIKFSQNLVCHGKNKKYSQEVYLQQIKKNGLFPPENFTIMLHLK